MALGSVELPSNWSPMDDDEHVKLVMLQATSQEYKKVESAFISTAQRTVSSVKKVNEIVIEILHIVRVCSLHENISQHV